MFSRLEKTREPCTWSASTWTNICESLKAGDRLSRPISHLLPSPLPCHSRTWPSALFLPVKSIETPGSRLREDAIERNNGAEGIYSVVDKQDCAVIVPIDGDHIWLVEQFRYTIGERALELPQGGWAQDNVDPEESGTRRTARRDRPDRGPHDGVAVDVDRLWLRRQRQHIFVAEELVAGPHQRDPEESRYGGSSGCPSPPSSRSSEMARFATCVRFAGPAIGFGESRG